MIYAIKKSCEIKISFVDKDVNEKGLRMKLNFGHTFAHAIEAKNNFSKRNPWRSCFVWNDFGNKTFCYKKVCNVKLLYDLENFIR